jgi:cell wall-associated NlpC family hydrolase
MLQDLDPDMTNCDTLWSRCDPIDQSAAQPGDLVFFERTYDTAGKSHVGFVTEAGGKSMISCRIPGVGEDSLVGTSWVQFLAGFGRVRS